MSRDDASRVKMHLKDAENSSNPQAQANALNNAVQAASHAQGMTDAEKRAFIEQYQQG